MSDSSGFQTSDLAAPLPPPQGTAGGCAAEIVSSILQAAHQLRGLLHSHYARFDLNGARYAALRMIQQSAPDGCSQAELADRLSQSESSVSGLVRRMRKSGLLYRLRSKNDQRKRVLLLSEQGRRMLLEIAQCHDHRSANLLSHFDAEQQQQLAELLQVLVEELSRIRSVWTTEDRPEAKPATADDPAVVESATADSKWIAKPNSNLWTRSRTEPPSAA